MCSLHWVPSCFSLHFQSPISAPLPPPGFSSEPGFVMPERPLLLRQSSSTELPRTASSSSAPGDTPRPDSPPSRAASWYTQSRTPSGSPTIAEARLGSSPSLKRDMPPAAAVSKSLEVGAGVHPLTEPRTGPRPVKRVSSRRKARKNGEDVPSEASDSDRNGAALEPDMLPLHRALSRRKAGRTNRKRADSSPPSLSPRDSAHGEMPPVRIPSPASPSSPSSEPGAPAHVPHSALGIKGDPSVALDALASPGSLSKPRGSVSSPTFKPQLSRLPPGLYDSVAKSQPLSQIPGMEGPAVDMVEDELLTRNCILKRLPQASSRQTWVWGGDAGVWGAFLWDDCDVRCCAPRVGPPPMNLPADSVPPEKGTSRGEPTHRNGSLLGVACAPSAAVWHMCVNKRQALLTPARSPL